MFAALQTTVSNRSRIHGGQFCSYEEAVRAGNRRRRGDLSAAPSVWPAAGPTRDKSTLSIARRITIYAGIPMSSDRADHHWGACPPGLIRGIARRTRVRRRKLLLREGVILLLLAASVGVAAGYLARPEAKRSPSAGPFDFAGVSCDEVHASLPELLADRLDPALAMQLRRHIAQCAQCRRLMQQMQPDRSLGKAAGASTLSRLAVARETRPWGKEPR